MSFNCYATRSVIETTMGNAMGGLDRSLDETALAVAATHLIDLHGSVAPIGRDQFRNSQPITRGSF
jgi:hypothetical protein